MNNIPTRTVRARCRLVHGTVINGDTETSCGVVRRQELEEGISIKDTTRLALRVVRSLALRHGSRLRGAARVVQQTTELHRVVIVVIIRQLVLDGPAGTRGGLEGIDIVVIHDTAHGCSGHLAHVRVKLGTCDRSEGNHAKKQENRLHVGILNVGCGKRKLELKIYNYNE